MRQRTEQIISSIPDKQRIGILNALRTLNTAIEAAGCCALNIPISNLVRIEEKQ